MYIIALLKRSVKLTTWHSGISNMKRHRPIWDRSNMKRVKTTKTGEIICSSKSLPNGMYFSSRIFKMDQFKSRPATSSDISTLYDLLNEYVIEENLEGEFTNSKMNFEEHFNQGLFKALIVGVQNETGNHREIIGCIFLSNFYDYFVGLTSFPHCCYIKPAFRNRGIEQKLFQHAKKESLDGNIHYMLTVLKQYGDVSYRSALQGEDVTNLTQNIATDVWIMQNYSSIPSQKYGDYGDYVIRGGTEKDLGGIYHLLKELVEPYPSNKTVTKEEFEGDGAVEKDLYGSVIMEHRRRLDNQDGDTEVIHNLVGFVLYSKMYYALMGRTYFLQGLYLRAPHKGKGLGKALICATLEACQKRHGVGFIGMVDRTNKVSQSLFFHSLHGTIMSQSKHKMEWIASTL